MEYNRTHMHEHKIRPGYAFVPVQHLDKLYTPKNALRCGTIFPELDIPMGEYERGIR